MPLLDTKINLNSGLQPDPLWQRIQQLCLDCVSATTTIQKDSTIWLQFELEGEQLEIPIPSVFLSLQEEHLLASRKDTNSGSQWLAAAAIAPLWGHAISPKLQPNLQLCLDALPIDAHVLYIGVMLARQPGIIRMNVSGICPLDLSDYLTQIDWPGPMAELQALAFQLDRLVDRIVLNLDIGETIAAKVGLECFIDRRLDRNAQWQPLLNYLVQNHLCTPEKCKALLSWPGFCSEESSPVPWPRNLTAISNFLGPRASSILVRDINHVELIFYAGTIQSARGYLWFGSDWLPPKN